MVATQLANETLPAKLPMTNDWGCVIFNLENICQKSKSLPIDVCHRHLRHKTKRARIDCAHHSIIVVHVSIAHQHKSIE